jgi:hypothetical protein
MASTSVRPPNGRVQTHGPIGMTSELPAWTSIVEEVHMDVLATSTGASHCERSYMHSVTEYIQLARGKLRWEHLYLHQNERLFAPNHCLSASVRLRHCNFLFPFRTRRLCTARPTQSSSHTGALAHSSLAHYDRGFLHAIHHPGKTSGTIGMRDKAIGRVDTIGLPKRPSCDPARTMNCKTGFVSNESAETAYGEE